MRDEKKNSWPIALVAILANSLAHALFVRSLIAHVINTYFITKEFPRRARVFRASCS